MTPKTIEEIKNKIIAKLPVDITGISSEEKEVIEDLVKSYLFTMELNILLVKHGVISFDNPLGGIVLDDGIGFITLDNMGVISFNNEMDEGQFNYEKIGMEFIDLMKEWDISSAFKSNLTLNNLHKDMETFEIMLQKATEYLKKGYKKKKPSDDKKEKFKVNAYDIMEYILNTPDDEICKQENIKKYLEEKNGAKKGSANSQVSKMIKKMDELCIIYKIGSNQEQSIKPTSMGKSIFLEIKKSNESQMTIEEEANIEKVK